MSILFTKNVIFLVRIRISQLYSHLFLIHTFKIIASLSKISKKISKIRFLCPKNSNKNYSVRIIKLIRFFYLEARIETFRILWKSLMSVLFSKLISTFLFTITIYTRLYTIVTKNIRIRKPYSKPMKITRLTSPSLNIFFKRITTRYQKLTSFIFTPLIIIKKKIYI